MHSVEDIQTKRRSLRNYIANAIRYADKGDYANVRLMFSHAEQEMQYLEYEPVAASAVSGVE